MKYILLPIFKFIWALFLTLTYCILTTTLETICLLLLLIWDFKWHLEIYEHTIGPFKKAPHISPYFKIRSHMEYYTFKSTFHYIWNIGEPK